MAIEIVEQFDQGTRIKVIGVGGGGGNAVQHMINEKVQGVEVIVANTGAQALGPGPEAGHKASQQQKRETAGCHEVNRNC